MPGPACMLQEGWLFKVTTCTCSNLPHMVSLLYLDAAAAAAAADALFEGHKAIK